MICSLLLAAITFYFNKLNSPQSERNERQIQDKSEGKNRWEKTLLRVLWSSILYLLHRTLFASAPFIVLRSALLVPLLNALQMTFTAFE